MIKLTVRTVKVDAAACLDTLTGHMANLTTESVQAKLVLTEEASGETEEGVVAKVAAAAKRAVSPNFSSQASYTPDLYMSKLEIVKLVKWAGGLSLMQAKAVVEAFHDNQNLDVDAFLGRPKNG